MKKTKVNIHIMTREIVISPNENLDFRTTYKKMLDCEDISCLDIDTNVSMKLIDANNNILMLIEVSEQDCQTNLEDAYGKGCFINRFEYVRSLIGTPIWENFISSFITAVKYAMCSREDGFLSRYTYIWAQTTSNEYTILNSLNSFQAIELGDIKTYIYRVN